MYDSYGFPQYVSVAEREAHSQKVLAKLRKKYPDLSPVVIDGTQIARSVWGKAWCKHLESFSDYSNRIPRGKSYVRSGAVVDLRIEKGLITALVTGSTPTPYEVRMEIACLNGARKEKIETLFREAESLALLDLLQGKLPATLMAALTDTREGLFPRVKEVKHTCSCPDYADFCKHQAAVLYGVGNRLDTQPELLFTLRGLDATVLTDRAEDTLTQAAASELGEMDLAALFGVELVDAALWTEKPQPEPKNNTPKRKQSSAGKESPAPSARVQKTPMDQLRYIQKYTQWDFTELARQLSTTANRVSKWSSGEAVPSAPIAKRIQKLYQDIKEIVEKLAQRQKSRGMTDRG